MTSPWKAVKEYNKAEGTRSLLREQITECSIKFTKAVTSTVEEQLLQGPAAYEYQRLKATVSQLARLEQGNRYEL